MKVRQLMTPRVIRISPGETAAVAARTLTQYNIGMLPVCGADGQLCGVVTDRDLVVRCMASGRQPGSTRVADLMTRQVTAVRPDMEASMAASLMARQQVRRLPVVENGRLCGMLSLADLAQEPDSAPDATDALAEISGNVSQAE